MLPSFSTFNFDLILGLFCFIGAQLGYFWCWGKVKKQFWRLLLLPSNSYSRLDVEFLFEFCVDDRPTDKAAPICSSPELKIWEKLFLVSSLLLCLFISSNICGLYRIMMGTQTDPSMMSYYHIFVQKYKF